MKRPAIALIALALSACTMINPNHSAPPEDWPSLKTEIVHDFWKTQECAGVPAPLAVTLTYVASGCAWIDFNTMTCTIYLAGDDDAALDHERLHCLGEDHVGSTALRDHWQRFKAWKASQGETKTRQVPGNFN